MSMRNRAASFLSLFALCLAATWMPSEGWCADVTARLNNGILEVSESPGHRGAGAGVEVYRDRDTIMVRGLQIYGTTINGRNSRRFRGVKELWVDLGDGPDVLLIGDRGALAPVFDFVSVRMGVERSLNDADELVIGNITVGEHLEIATGDGDDIVSSSADIGPVGFNSMLVDTGAGADDVLIQNCLLGELTVVTAYSQYERDKDDVQFYDLVTDGSIFVHTGRGGDDLRAENLSLGGNLTFNADQGIDSATIVGCDMNKALMNMGRGNDEIWMFDSTIGQSALDGGAGANDSLRYEDVDTSYALTGWEWVNGRNAGIYATFPINLYPVLK